MLEEIDSLCKRLFFILTAQSKINFFWQTRKNPIVFYSPIGVIGIKAPNGLILLGFWV